MYAVNCHNSDRNTKTPAHNVNNATRKWVMQVCILLLHVIWSPKCECHWVRKPSTQDDPSPPACKSGNLPSDLTNPGRGSNPQPTACKSCTALIYPPLLTDLSKGYTHTLWHEYGSSSVHLPKLDVTGASQQRGDSPLGQLAAVVLKFRGEHCAALVVQTTAPVHTTTEL